MAASIENMEAEDSVRSSDKSNNTAANAAEAVTITQIYTAE